MNFEVPYSGKVLKENTFANFTVLYLYISESDCLNAQWTVGSTSEQFTKSYFSTNLRKFSHSKDSRYTWYLI